jgi:glutathione synthase/RimK-type ligase-like ATP-grasp enzyme
VGYKILIINSSIPEMVVDTIMESRDAIFFENEFPMKNAPSTTGHKFIIFHEHENFTPIKQIKESHMQNPDEDDTIVTRKIKRQRTAKSFGDEYIVYLVNNTPTTIEEAYSSPDTDL